MRALGISALVLLAWLCLPATARANGYGVNSPALAWSPTGEWLAAVVGATWPPDDLVTGELRLYDRYGRYAVLAHGIVGSPSFSPDGALAAVVDGNVWLFAVQGIQSPGQWSGKPQQCTTRSDVLDCRFGPVTSGIDSLLYFSAGERFYGSGIYTLSAPGQVPKLLAQLGAETSVYGPVPAANGLVCYLQQPGPDAGAYERLMYGQPGFGPCAQVCRPFRRADDYHESNPLWLGERTLLFQRGGWGDWTLLRVDTQTQNEVIEANDAESPSLSNDLRLLAFARRDPAAKALSEAIWELPCSIWVRDRQQGIEQQLSPAGADCQQPALSPDGKRVAWLEYGSAGVRVVVRSNPL